MRRLGAFAVAAVLAVPVLVWCAIGPLTEGDPDDMDHIVRVPQPDRWVELGVGALAAAGLLAFGVAVVRAGRARPEVWDWSGAFLGAAVAGGLLAGIGRLVTAGSIGANIGGGVAMVLGVPIAIGVAVAAVNAIPD